MDNFQDLIKKIDFNNNLLLNCDNLFGLKILKTQMKEKIDVIYIDPPYYFNKIKNKNSFKYNSNFDLSNWLLFLSNRLEIAKELLTKDGIIFISINEDGLYHLKLLSDQVFGLENHLTTIKWNKNNTQNDTMYFQENCENILVYKKDEFVNLKEVEFKKIKVLEKKGKFYLKKGTIFKGGEDGYLNNSTNLGYSIYYNPHTKDVITKNDYDKIIAKKSNNYEEIYEKEDENLIKKGYICIRPPISKGRIKRWTWGIDKMNKEHEKLLFIEKKDGTFSINSLKEISKENIKNGYYLEKIYKAPKNYISISSSKGTKRINDLFHGKENFAYSKPVELMNYLLELFVDKKDIKVLDFFAGSGTIGESVILLNKKDNQNRKFYLIEQMDYANSLTFERLKLVKKLEKIDVEIQFIKIEN